MSLLSDRLRYRRTALFSFVLAGLLVAAACAPGQDDADDSETDPAGQDEPDQQAEEVEEEGPATLTVWTDPARQPGFEAYQEAHPDVTLNIEQLPEDFQQRLLLANEAGSGWPDVVYASLFVGPALPQAPFDLSADVSGYLSDGIIDGYGPGIMEDCLGDSGEVYCLRNDIAPLVLWYNTELMDDFGYDVPTTWEEFEELGLRLADEHPGYVVGPQVPVGNYFKASRCPAHEVVDTQTIKVDLSDPTCTRVATMLDNLAEAGALAPMALQDPEYAAEYGVEQRILMAVGQVFQGVIHYQNNFEWEDGTLGVAPPLRWENEDEVFNYSGGGGYYVVSRHTEFPQAATDLVTWMATGDYQTDPSTGTFPAYGPAQDPWMENHTDFFTAADGDVAGVIAQATDALWDGRRDMPHQPVQRLVNEVVNPAVIGEGRTITEMLPDWEEAIVNEATAAGWTVVGGDG